MGPHRKGQQHDEGMDRVSEEEAGAVQRHPHHLHVGTQQTTHPRRTANGHAGPPGAQTPHSDLGTERTHAAAHRELPAPCDQRQVHQNQVRDAAPDPDAAVRVLRQPAAVHQGTLPAVPRKQHARTLGLLGRADANLFPPEIKQPRPGMARATVRPASTRGCFFGKTGRRTIQTLQNLERQTNQGLRRSSSL